ncbi:MAG: hypothetical protein JO261_05635 [Alphaproteobacteria bacterium]|nr:hypothetical protein [Alphaproteobacteria bacterium]MBV9693162.1 hypothetical protein [Alphaproteobacteria bacterium]
MELNATDLCRLAADLALEHGDAAQGYARRAIVCFEAQGSADRARLWFALSVLLDDIALKRLDPDCAIVIH